MTQTQFNRFSKVVANAISEGFEVDEHKDLETILCDAENHLLSNCKYQKFEHCTLNSDGRSQYYYFLDKDGHEFNSTGEIFDFGKYKADKGVYYRFEENGKFTPVSWFDIPMEGEERSNYVFVFDIIVDCEGEVVALYDCFE